MEKISCFSHGTVVCDLENTDKFRAIHELICEAPVFRDVEGVEYLEKAVYNLLELTRIEDIDGVAVDLHPSFNTSRLGKEMAEKFDAELIECQHV